MWIVISLLVLVFAEEQSISVGLHPRDSFDDAMNSLIPVLDTVIYNGLVGTLTDTIRLLQPILISTQLTPQTMITFHSILNNTNSIMKSLNVSSETIITLESMLNTTNSILRSINPSSDTISIIGSILNNINSILTSLNGPIGVTHDVI